jgi:hypothetical protein
MVGAMLVHDVVRWRDAGSELLGQTPSTRHRVQRAKVTAQEIWRDDVLK